MALIATAVLFLGLSPMLHGVSHSHTAQHADAAHALIACGHAAASPGAHQSCSHAINTNLAAHACDSHDQSAPSSSSEAPSDERSPATCDTCLQIALAMATLGGVVPPPATLVIAAQTCITNDAVPMSPLLHVVSTLRGRGPPAIA